MGNVLNHETTNSASTNWREAETFHLASNASPTSKHLFAPAIWECGLLDGTILRDVSKSTTDFLNAAFSFDLERGNKYIPFFVAVWLDLWTWFLGNSGLSIRPTTS